MAPRDTLPALLQDFASQFLLPFANFSLPHKRSIQNAKRGGIREVQETLAHMPKLMAAISAPKEPQGCSTTAPMRLGSGLRSAPGLTLGHRDHHPNPMCTANEGRGYGLSSPRASGSRGSSSRLGGAGRRVMLFKTLCESDHKFES